MDSCDILGKHRLVKYNMFTQVGYGFPDILVIVKGWKLNLCLKNMLVIYEPLQHKNIVFSQIYQQKHCLFPNLSNLKKILVRSYIVNNYPLIAP